MISLTNNGTIKLFTSDYLQVQLFAKMDLDLSFQESIFTSDLDILESTHKEYFISCDLFDASRFALITVSQTLDSEDIVIQSKQLVRQYNVILKKLLSLILDKQVKFKEQFSNIMKIQAQLNIILKICESCRDNLTTASHQFSLSSLLILYYYRKRKIFGNLIKILYGIKTLNRTKDKLHRLLDCENYPAVISLISDCQKSIETYKQYNCVVSLHNKLIDTLEFVEENLDLSISNICTSFNVNNYASAQHAYKFLGKSQTAIDQLHMHFIATIHSTAFSSVLKYAQNDSKTQYTLLCQSVPVKNFYPCLLELCRSFLSILKSYYFVIKWHENESSMDVHYEAYANVGKDHNQEYILQKLQAGIVKICNDVETKIIIFIDGFDITNLKFEELMQALNTIDRMLKIGKVICRSNMTKLYECSKNKLLNYFNLYHASRLEELKIFLENDGWGLCPIKPSFRITQLVEFKTFKSIFNLSKNSRNTEENLFQVVEDFDNYDISQVCSVNVLFPFDLNFGKPVEEDILRSSEMNNDFSNTLGTSLKRTISRIKENLIISGMKNSSSEHKVYQPHRSSVINLDDSKNIFGLTERIVAVESLIFLGHQYQSFQLYLNSIIIDDQERADLNQSCFQSVSLTTTLRKPVYKAAILRAFDISHILFLINKVDWELKDIISQHNDYINVLLEEIRVIKEKMTIIELNVPLSKEISESIWESVSDILTHVLVEGFAAVKKCSHEGRALMQLDFTQFVSKFEAITALRPMPHQEFVTAYIKAYYSPESSIESWIRNHSEYSPKQLVGLVACINQNKKTKQKLLSVIEEQRLSR